MFEVAPLMRLDNRDEGPRLLLALRRLGRAVPRRGPRCCAILDWRRRKAQSRGRVARLAALELLVLFCTSAILPMRG